MEEISFTIKNKFRITFNHIGESCAKGEFKAFYFASEIQDLKYLFPSHLSNRLLSRLKEIHDQNEDLQDFWERVVEIDQIFIESILKDRDAILNISALVYSNLLIHCSTLSDTYKKLSEQGANLDSEIINEFSKLLVFPNHFWKSILDSYEITLSDLPTNYEEHFEDFDPNEINDMQPDGTFYIRDENDKLQKRWLPPEVFENLIETGKAYRIYQIFIKGPWKKIKQIYLKLTDQQIQEFLNKNEEGFGFGWYENDEFKVMLVNKEDWDKFNYR